MLDFNLGPQKGPSSTAKIQAETRYIRKMLGPFTQKAYDIAKEAHRGQKRWSGADYFSEHVCAVAKIAQFHSLHLPEAWRDNFDCVSAAAYLHDTVEDTTVTLEDLSKEFSPLTVDIVKNLTHAKDETYFDYIMRIHSGIYGAQFVKLCDLAHNLSDLSPTKNKNMWDKYKLAQYILEKSVGFTVEYDHVR